MRVRISAAVSVSNCYISISDVSLNPSNLQRS